MFRVVHPFHPGCGKQLPIVTIRQNWGDELLYYRDTKGQLISIPVRWTDRIEPDPIVTISAGRSPFRLQDLMELARLVEVLGQEVPHER